MRFLGFGRRSDPGLERQRQAVAHVSAEFDALEERVAGLPALKASFDGVWEDVPALDEISAKLPAMRELLGLLKSRARDANVELPNFDGPLTTLAREVGYGQGLLETLAVTLVTKQGLSVSRKHG